MKKTICLLTAVMLILLTGCGQGKTDSAKETKADTTEQSSADADEKPAKAAMSRIKTKSFFTADSDSPILSCHYSEDGLIESISFLGEKKAVKCVKDADTGFIDSIILPDFDENEYDFDLTELGNTITFTNKRSDGTLKVTADLDDHAAPGYLDQAQKRYCLMREYLSLFCHYEAYDDAEITFRCGECCIKQQNKNGVVRSLTADMGQDLHRESEYNKNGILVSAVNQCASLEQKSSVDYLFDKAGRRSGKNTVVQAFGEKQKSETEASFDTNGVILAALFQSETSDTVYYYPDPDAEYYSPQRLKSLGLSEGSLLGHRIISKTDGNEIVLDTLLVNGRTFIGQTNDDVVYIGDTAVYEYHEDSVKEGAASIEEIVKAAEAYLAGSGSFKDLTRYYDYDAFSAAMAWEQADTEPYLSFHDLYNDVCAGKFEEYAAEYNMRRSDKISLLQAEKTELNRLKSEAGRHKWAGYDSLNVEMREPGLFVYRERISDDRGIWSVNFNIVYRDGRYYLAYVNQTVYTVTHE